jgi:hypothetical protein
MRGFLKKTAMERARGGRASPPRAMLASAAAGAVAAVVTYRVLRA